MKLIISTLLMLTLVGCIGKVEDLNPETTKNSGIKDKIVSFAGITRLLPISSSKLEVYFSQVSGNPADIIYQIYVNNSSVPIEIKGVSLTSLESGENKYTLSNLQPATQYVVSVGFKNVVTGEISGKNSALSAVTFSNHTADFNGISDVVPLDGIDGTEQVKVSWSPAVSKGSDAFPKNEDPVAYIVSYIKASDGSPFDLMNPLNSRVTTRMIPTSLNGSPSLSKERSRVVQGLLPDTRYYFNVRAIHAGFVSNKDNPFYKVEENTTYKTVKTLRADTLIEWDNQFVEVSKTTGESSLSSVEVKWDKGSGPFSAFRMVYQKVGAPSDDPLAAEASLSLDDTYFEQALANNQDIRVDASESSLVLSGLDQYSWYKLMIVQCYNSVCDDGNRKLGRETFFQVTPQIAPFLGVLNISNPESIFTSDRIKVHFDSPLTSLGFLTKLKVFCHQDVNDTNPVLMDYNTELSLTGKANCDGLKLLTNNQLTPGAFGTLKNFEIEGDFFTPGQSISSKNICFSVYPEIVGDTLHTGQPYQEDGVGSKVIKCIQPKIVVPTIDTFPGLTMNCNISEEENKLTWSLPTAGFYDRFVIFYKEGKNEPFKFSDAIKEEVDSVPLADRKYMSIWNLSSSVVEQTVTDLKAGSDYQFGILTYLDQSSASDHLYSEKNVNILNCSVPLPTATFQEWVDIFAVGPKADGRIPQDAITGKKHYLFETINHMGQPIEVEVEDLVGGSYTQTQKSIDQFGAVTGAQRQEFNGVLGTYGGDASLSPKAQYSNSGIVRIGWKDIVINKAGGTSMWDEIVNQGDNLGLKIDRKYGYHVYRSSDGQRTWKLLTDDNQVQKPNNEGLIHPVDFVDRALPNSDINLAENSYKAVIFTDYSLKKPEDTTLEQKGRILHYKIVPLVNGKEITFSNPGVYPQNIVKVILPPENMAYISRLMANRQTCRELGKPYSQDISTNYSCEYNGLGSKAKTVIPTLGQTIYDFGGDLLVDRFELGCNVTRGGQQLANSTLTKSSPANSDFRGLNDDDGLFRGCLNFSSQVAGTENISSPRHPGTSYPDYQMLRKGDCLFENFEYFDTNYRDTLCSSDARNIRPRPFIAPGVNIDGGTSTGMNCDISEDRLLNNFFNPYSEASTNYYRRSTQSEYLAVGYSRTRETLGTYERYSIPFYPGANSTESNSIRIKPVHFASANSCMINIPVAINTGGTFQDGRIYPRWFSLGDLDSLDYDGNRFSILDLSVDEVKSHNFLFDNSANSLYETNNYTKSWNKRFESETKISRVITSNNSKLPPVTGITRDMGNQLCRGYDVQLGYFNDDSEVFSPIGESKKKRLVRRPEGIIAAAWPRSFDEQRVELVEVGENETGGDEAISPTALSEVNFRGGCNTYERGVPSGQDDTVSRSGDFLSSLITSNRTQAENSFSFVRPSFFTGSSWFDGDSSNFNTQHCTSRYGLQDIVGNMREVTSDSIFCGTEAESLRVIVDGVSYSLEELGESPVINYDIFYDKNKIQFEVSSGAGTGSCSVVEFQRDASDPVTNSLMNEPFNLFGEAISSVVPKVNQLDPFSIKELRSGNGRFLSGGQNRELPALSYYDTWGLRWIPSSEIDYRSDGVDPRKGKFFNPVVGLPLECGGESCSGYALDNSLYSISYFDSNLIPSEKVALKIADFPIGNSQILNVGMSEGKSYYRFTTGAVLPVGSAKLSNYTWLDVDTSDPANPTLVKANVSNSDTTYTPNVEVNAYQWSLYRNSNSQSFPKMKNFGGTKSRHSGRYSMEVESVNDYSERRQNKDGIRCGVKFE